MKSLVVISCVVFLQLFFEVRSSQPSYEGDSVVREGESLRIVCKISMREPFALEWLKDDMTINLSLENEYFIVDEFIESDAALQSVLSVRRADVSHSGHYRCNKFSSHSHLVMVLPADKVDSNAMEFHYNLGKELVLPCTLDAESVSWKKNHVELVLESGHIVAEKVENEHQLRFIHAKQNDHGNYTCEADGKIQEFIVGMDPFIDRLQQSYNVVEGDKFVLECKASGHPLPTIKWTRCPENAEITPDAEQVRVENGTLIIESMKPEDRCEYTCVAANQHGSTNHTTFVRVVDKYAALWPFLGICAEVAVLCTIIFIYEKRRSKTDFDESDGEQTNDTKHTVNAKDADVRQRK